MRLRTLFVSFCLLATVAVPAVATAQIVSRAADSRIWVDVNFGFQMSAAPETTFTFTYATPFNGFGELGHIGVTYPTPSTTMPFDIGGGFMFHRRVGVGASYTRASMSDSASAFANIPDPDFQNTRGIGSMTTQALKRTETAFNIHAMFVLMSNDRMTIRAHAGPSFFSFNGEMVYNVNWNQTLNATDNTVTVTGYTTQGATGRGMGFHGGADFNYFFNDMIGVGGGIRITRATIELEREPMSELAQDVKVGGTQILFGLRLRFR